jgi:catechol 2,3-dioxygenase-like lactoylglutathione lyase family enzyme
MPAKDIHHIAVKTADVDATVKFYNEVLGTRSVSRPPFDFPGAWLHLGSTMVHVYGGQAAQGADGKVARGGGALDHVALAAHDFDAMRETLRKRALDWRENEVTTAGLWQLFVHDPSGVLIELNFPTADEPKGAKGPDGNRRYVAGQF